MSDNGTMTAAITITLLAVLCTAAIFATLLIGRRPTEGWRAWVRSSFTAWRSDELSWHETGTDPDDVETGGLGTLYQLSEPGHAYVTPPEDLEERLSAVTRHRLHPGVPRRASHAG